MTSISATKPNPPLRADRNAILDLQDAAMWLGQLNGTDDPKGQAELREEFAKARAALDRIAPVLGA